MKSNWHGVDFISTDSLTSEGLTELFDRADAMKQLVEEKGGNDALRGRVMASLFYEPSSRTFGSFAAAMQRLGGGVIPLNMSQSSVVKGESLSDTAKVFSSYADVIVMRNPEVGSAQTMAESATVPVISAGDGIGEHPTQALLDAYTIRAELGGSLEKLHIVMVGEMAHYRPVNSLAKLLALFPGIKLSFVAGPEFSLQEGVRDYLKAHNVDFTEHEDLDDVIESADALYVTRPKKEFIAPELYEKALGKYRVDTATVAKMKPNSIVMHALPRLDEIAIEVDADPRAVYLTKQMKNGMYTRMALLDLIING